MQAFYTDWPDVARATEVMIRGMLSQTVRRMYQDLAGSLAPYLETINTLADRSQLMELQSQVSDYDTIAAQLSAWTARQPAYLRSAYEHVMRSGTAADVVDLINRYKQDMQTTASSSPQAPMAPQAAPVPLAAPSSAPAAPVQAPQPVPAALAAAAARLAPVSAKRGAIIAPPIDYDAAFAEFAKAS